MDLDWNEYLSALRENGLVPDSAVAVYFAGSLVKGWGNALSDLDVYVITAEPWTGPDAEVRRVNLDPEDIRIEVMTVGERRLDVEYWTEDQFHQVLRKVSHDEFDMTKPKLDLVAYSPERGLLEKFPESVAVIGEDWVSARKEELESSAWRKVGYVANMYVAELYTEDAAGQLGEGDHEAAVLAAKEALVYAITALLASYGQFGGRFKWRARCFREAKPAELSFDEYWRLETMRDFDPDHPDRWVEDVLLLCRRIAMEVRL